jgi:hypothetical protein
MYSSATQTATTQHSTAQHSTYVPVQSLRSFTGFRTAITIMPGSGGEIVVKPVGCRGDMPLSIVCVSSFALSGGWVPRPGRIPTAACGLTHDLQNRSECWSAEEITHREDLHSSTDSQVALTD